MSFSQDLRAYLVSKGPITAAVGQRVYQDDADQGAQLPYIVFELSGSDPTYSLSGATGTAVDNYEITAFAASALRADQVADALRDCLSGYNAGMGRERTSVCALIVDRNSGYEPPDDGSGRGAYFSTTTFSIGHTEPKRLAVPTP